MHYFIPFTTPFSSLYTKAMTRLLLSRNSQRRQLGRTAQIGRTTQSTQVGVDGGAHFTSSQEASTASVPPLRDL